MDLRPESPIPRRTAEPRWLTVLTLRDTPRSAIYVSTPFCGCGTASGATGDVQGGFTLRTQPQAQASSFGRDWHYQGGGGEIQRSFQRPSLWFDLREVHIITGAAPILTTIGAACTKQVSNRPACPLARRGQSLRGQVTAGKQQLALWTLNSVPYHLAKQTKWPEPWTATQSQRINCRMKTFPNVLAMAVAASVIHGGRARPPANTRLILKRGNVPRLGTAVEC